MDFRDAAGENPHLGVVGIGRMGSPIAEQLSRIYRVSVFDVDPEREGAIEGTRWVGSAQELVARSEVLLTILPGPVELGRYMADALPLLRPGSLWIDLTSGDPVVTRELALQADGRGVQVVSAPIGGSIAEAATADLVFYVSGSDDAIARARPILEVLSRVDGLRRAGARAEDGQIVKLLANALWFANAIAASEAMLVGDSLGIPAGRLHHLLRDSAGGSRFLDEHFGGLLDGDYLNTFGIDRVVEELDTVSAMSSTAGVRTPMLDASARLHHAALDRFGPALGELLAVRLLEEDSGRQLRR